MGLLITFGAKSTEWLNKLNKRQIVFLTDRLDVSTAQHGHQRRKHIEYKLLSSLLTLRHLATGRQL